MNDFAGYMLLVDGCPYAFATKGVNTSSLPTLNADWSNGITPSRVLPFLKSPDYSWSETIKPVDGQFDASSITFRLFDGPATIEGTLRDNASTYLFTRTNQAWTRLGATLSSSGSAMTVETPADIFGTGSFVVWSEKEAMLCEGRTGTAITIASRSYYGTVSSSHTIDTVNSYKPLVFADYPGAKGKRVTFWRCDGDNSNWYVMWRGMANRAPRFSGDGKLLEIQCDQLWPAIKGQNFNVTTATVHLAGADKCMVGMGLSYTPQTVGNPIMRFAREASETDDNTYQAISANAYDALQEARTNLHEALINDYGIAPGDVVLDLRPDETTGKLKLDFRLDCDTLTARVRAGKSYESQGTNSLSGLRAGIINNIDQFQVLHRLDTFGDTTYLHIDDASRLPTTFYNIGSRDTCRITDVFTAEDTEQEHSITFYPSASFPNHVPCPKIKGKCTAKPLNVSSPDVPPGELLQHYKPLEFTFRRQLQADYWLGAVRYGIVDGFLDSRNWNWSSYDRVRTTTGLINSPVDWNVGNGETFGSFIENYCKFYVCAVATAASGKLTVVPIRSPNVWDSSAATFTNADYTEQPTWSISDDAVVNTVKIESELYDGFTINDNDSKGLFGNGYEITINLKDMADEVELARNKERLIEHINRRFFALFSRPYGVASITVNMSWFNVVYLGDFVTITDWIIPDGTGIRGLSGHKGLVIGKTTDLKAGNITFEVMVFQPSNTTSTRTGYAPCVRIELINSGSSYVDIDTGYISTGNTGDLTDYAGSNRSDYDGTANDGGASFFTVNDKVQLILRDFTNIYTFSTTITGKPTDTRFTISPVPDASSPSEEYWYGYCGSGSVDMRFNNYDTPSIQTDQKKYAYVGNYVTGYITSSTDRAQVLT